MPRRSTRELEQILRTTALTLGAVALIVGLAAWLWVDRHQRTVPGPGDLVELHGLASSAEARPRSRSVWLRFQADAPRIDGLPAPDTVRVLATDLPAIASAFAGDPVRVVVSVVRRELGGGPRDDPPTAMQLRTASGLLVPLAEGQRIRAELAGNAWLSAGIAMAGMAAVLVVLVIHWVGVLRRSRPSTG